MIERLHWTFAALDATRAEDLQALQQYYVATGVLTTEAETPPVDVDGILGVIAHKVAMTQQG